VCCLWIRRHNEVLIAEALRTYRPGRPPPRPVVVATKGGIARPHGEWQSKGSRVHLLAAAQASLQRLGGRQMDLYQLHCPDDDVPWSESVGALKEIHVSACSCPALPSHSNAD
jgi:aryl-alcohol dehydrogenase-like predicted oxidoreductase